MSGYAVVDLQTTGLEPSRQHRVVEIAMVLLSETGELEESWCTLVNPQRDVGETSIHGISARDVLPAPIFDDLVPLVLRSVTGRTLVAHNLGFELGFLESELRRCGVPLSMPLLVGVATMEWFRILSARKRRRLVDCCEEVGIALARRYRSDDQATAVAELLRRYIETTGGSPPWADALTWSRAYPWPQLTSDNEQCRLLMRGGQQNADDASWLDRIIGKMPTGGSLAVDSYLDVLEMALLDRYLSAHEIDSLLAVAAGHGLTRQVVEGLHRDYLTAMANVALEDGIVTATERRDLVRVATLLGLAEESVDDALAKAPTRPSGTPKKRFLLAAGDAICFTGTTSIPRHVLEREAEAAGLVVGGLTRRTKLLVAADPDSLSGKAKKARDYGIVIVSDTGFQSLLRQSTTN